MQSREEPGDRDPLSRYQPRGFSSLRFTGVYNLRLFYYSYSAHLSSIMAIHPKLRPEGSQCSLSPQQTIAISAWTEQAAASLEDLTLSDSTPADRTTQPPPTRSPLCGATVAVSIPLDDQPPATPSRVRPSTEETRPPTVSFRRREPLRRDSLKRREALLKGKDGSRRRQRWENGRLSTGLHSDSVNLG